MKEGFQNKIACAVTNSDGSTWWAWTSMVVATIEVEEEDFVLVVWGSIIVKRRILFLKISNYSLE